MFEKHIEITEERLRELGFENENSPIFGPSLSKNLVDVHDYNGRYWVVEMLENAGIDCEFRYMYELENFFSACGLDIGSE